MADEDDTAGKKNLGTIMSGRKDMDDTDDGSDDGDDGTDDDADDGPDGMDQQHPVATVLAKVFDVTYEDVMELHLAGNGFGNIVKAYFFAEELEMDPSEVLEQAHLSGWGSIFKEAGVHPGSVGNGGKNSNRPEHAGGPKDGPPGQLKKGTDPTTLGGQDGVGKDKAQGNAGGHSYGKGHGKGNGKGQGKK
ncbi:MAG: hypothetical protein JSV03_02165 [Planctomycetota bacterium]|nr:MAG: hypothetical protein JSV03_02165 [Planctomycetota bacterium]